jgi:hypothetical protein
MMLTLAIIKRTITNISAFSDKVTQVIGNSKIVPRHTHSNIIFVTCIFICCIDSYTSQYNTTNVLP